MSISNLSNPLPSVNSADKISFDPETTDLTATNVQQAIEQLFTSVSDGKTLIASAITDKGVETDAGATFRQMADNIADIPSGGSLPDDVCSIKLSVSNDASGSVTGGGIAQKGMTVKVKAAPNLDNNWMFTHWSENGEMVSQTNPYQFRVESDRNLVANFDNTYKFGENWFLTFAYSGSSKITPSALSTFLYNPHTESFFFSYTAASIYEAKIDSGRFKGAGIGSGSPYFTIDDEGNLWYIKSNNGSLVKFNIKTRTEEIVCPKADLPETSTYTWTFAAYGNGVYVIVDSKSSSYAYSHDAVEWTISKMAATTTTISDFKFLNGYFIATRSGSNSNVFFSVDGIVWKEIKTLSNPSAAVKDICHMYDDKFLVTGVQTAAIISVESEEREFIEKNGAISDPYMGCAYADGVFIFFRSGLANKNPTFYYGTDSNDIKETNPITDVVYTTRPTAMRGAYGNGAILVLTQDSSNVIYTTPSGPFKA